MPPSNCGSFEHSRAAALACATNDDAKLRELLASGLSPDTKAMFCITVQMSNGAHARTPEKVLPLLFIACQSVATDCVKVLLEAGADFSARCDMAELIGIDAAGTALDCCFAFQRSLQRPSYALDCARLILAAKADPNVLLHREPDGCTELMLACQDGEISVARLLLDHGANPNHGERNGSSALFKAAQEGHAGVCRLLINGKANLEAKFASGCTPIGIAASQGREACVKLLLCAHADATVVAHADGQTPADLARAGGHLSIVKMLSRPLLVPPTPAFATGTRVRAHGLVARPELNDQTATVLEFDGLSGRYAVIFHAAAFDATGVSLKPTNLAMLPDAPAELPADAPADPRVHAPANAPADDAVDVSDAADASAASALEALGARAHTAGVPTEAQLDVLTDSIAKGKMTESDVTAEREALLSNASPAGGADGSSSSSSGESLRAAGSRRVAAPTASTPVRPMEAWTLLTCGGNTFEYAMDLLRRRDFDVNVAFPSPPNQSASGKTTTLLVTAANLMLVKDPTVAIHSLGNLRPQPGLVRALLECAADVNGRTESGSTALHLACHHGHLPHVQLLLDHRADVMAADKDGMAPLMCAMRQKDATACTAVVRALAAAGDLQIDHKDAQGYTAFVAAVEWGAGPEVLSQLLALGASVNAETHYPGFTALAAAAAGNTTVDPSIVKFLLEVKADASIKYVLPNLQHDSKKQPPIYWARAQNRKAVVDILEALGSAKSEIAI